MASYWSARKPTDKLIHEHPEFDIDGRCHVAGHRETRGALYSREAAKKSGEKLLEAKRKSRTVIDVLKNVAEALQRVRGLSISREFGEGERVSIRSFNYLMLVI